MSVLDAAVLAHSNLLTLRVALPPLSFFEARSSGFSILFTHLPCFFIVFDYLASNDQTSDPVRIMVRRSTTTCRVHRGRHDVGVLIETEHDGFEFRQRYGVVTGHRAFEELMS